MTSQPSDIELTGPQGRNYGLWITAVLLTLMVMFQVGVMIIWPLLEQRYPVPPTMLTDNDQSSSDPASDVACMGVLPAFLYAGCLILLPAYSIYYLCKARWRYAVVSLYCVVFSLAGLWLSWSLLGMMLCRILD